MPFLETSAKDDVGIGAVFQAMVTAIREAASKALDRSDIQTGAVKGDGIRLDGASVSGTSRKKLLPCCS